MNTSPLDDHFITAGNSADTIIQIAKSEMKDYIAQQVDGVYLGRS